MSNDSPPTPRSRANPPLPTKIKREVGGLLRKWRGREGGLPQFVIVGTQKGGTSSLYDYLVQHPQVAAARRKEVHYFEVNYRRGDKWYRDFFPSPAEMAPAKVTGESSPFYMFHPHVPRRMRELIPDARLIFLLRNPVERAISHYFHEVRQKTETLPFEEAIAREEERLHGQLERLLADEHDRAEPYQRWSYAARGRYLEQIRRFEQHFPREQMLIHSSEEFFGAVESVLRSCFRFFDVDPGFMPADLTARNVGRDKSRVPEHLRQQLAAYFRPYNKALYEHLGRDFGWDDDAE